MKKKKSNIPKFSLCQLPLLKIFEYRPLEVKNFTKFEFELVMESKSYNISKIVSDWMPKESFEHMKKSAFLELMSEFYDKHIQ